MQALQDWKDWRTGELVVCNAAGQRPGELYMYIYWLRRHSTDLRGVPNRLLGSPKSILRGLKMEPGSSKSPWERPRSSPERPKSRPRRPRSRLKRPKIAPRASKIAPRASKRRPRDPKRLPKGAQEDPRGPKRVPKWSPKGPKSRRNQGEIAYGMHRVFNSVFEANFCIFSLEFLSLE